MKTTFSEKVWNNHLFWRLPNRVKGKVQDLLRCPACVDHPKHFNPCRQSVWGHDEDGNKDLFDCGCTLGKPDPDINRVRQELDHAKQYISTLELDLAIALNELEKLELGKQQPPLKEVA